MATTFEKFYKACVLGNRAAVEDMLDEDPSLVRATDDMGFTALHGVAGEEQAELAEFLIKKGADVSAKNDVDMTPLHIAQNTSIIEVLIRYGADINAKAHFGWTPLLVQAQESEESGALETIEALLKAGADPNMVDDRGHTALAFAVSRQEDDKILLLRHYGAEA